MTDRSVPEIMRRVPPATRPTVQAARRAVKAVAPSAKELSYRSRRPRSSRAMWKLVRYAVEDVYLAGIGTFADHVSLFFPRGRELDDGSGLLEGRGKEFRSVTLRSPADARRPAVQRILRKALRLAKR